MILTELLSRVKRLEVSKERYKRQKEAAHRADIKELIADCYYDLHEDMNEGRHEFYNLPGGRGSGKSSFCSLEVVFGIMNDATKTANALVVRKYAVTLRGSVFAQIQWAIDALGVSDLWKATYNPMEFKYVTGQTIRLTGLDDSQKLKSIKPYRGYFKYMWLEEFSEISGELELRSLQQSVLRGGSDFVVMRSFNPPISKANWANQFIARPDDRAVTYLTNYTQVPPEWLGEEFIIEAERLKEINPKAYEHEYLGLPVGNGSEVFPNLEIREITNEEISFMQYFYSGIDFGFAVDPFCYIRTSYNHKYDVVYLLDEIYERGWSNQQIADEIKRRKYDEWEVVCDSAEPKSIADLRRLGIWGRHSYKRPSSVEFGVKWLQHRKVVIDPRRTPNAYREFTQYAYAVDRNGEILSQLVDKDNHTIDATRYALERLIYGWSTTA